MAEISGPWFEDFRPGDDFSGVPSVTLTEGYAAIHQAITGDRQRLSLDMQLCKAVTGVERLLANPSLVCNLAIGQSTIPSQRVLGNLFYRGLHFKAPVFIGDTLSTRTEVVALRQNQKREGRPASGMVVLKMHVTNQHNETILKFYRCPMIPCRDPEADTGQADDFSQIPDGVSDADLESSLPDWDYQAYAASSSHVTSPSSLPWQLNVEARDTVTLAPELVRLTLNMAMTHTDVARSVYDRRLVYGGHTISIAAAQLTRAIPDLVTIAAWHSCDHLAPVFEGDILRSEISLEKITSVGQCRLADIRVSVFASRVPLVGEPAADEIKVLDWHLIGVLP